MPIQLTKNFSLEEFACKDGSSVPDQYLENVKELAKNLQVLRDELGVSITILSGYRSPEHNKEVDGKKASKHLIAQAADIVTRKHTPKQLANIIEKLIADKKMKQGGLGLYPSFVHYDIRGIKARW